MFFTNQGFQNKINLTNILDGDILQLLSINNEAGIEPFDLENPKYVAYQYNVLDPEFYPKVFKLDSGVYGPLPVTFDLKEDGERVRACLNEPSHVGYDNVPVQGRLTESSQPVPFYLWDKLGTGFGPYNEFSDDQAWDYSSVQLQPLQGMTYGYNITGVPNDSSDKYLLLPMTYTFSGLTISGNTVDEINFDIVDESGTDSHNDYNLEYPGFTYLYVTARGIQSLSDGSNQLVTAPTGGTLYTRVGPAESSFTYQGITITNGWHQQTWSSNVDYIIRPTFDYYGGNKQILSTPFQFYFGLMAGKTGMDKFVDMFGPKGAFNLLECDTTPPPLPTSTFTPTPTPTVTPTPTPTSTSTSPTASFTTSIITASRPGSPTSAGTTTETSGTTITVINGTVTIRLKTWVITGYRSNTSLTIGINTYSPGESGQGITGGIGESNASSTTFTLGVGTYVITNWTVSAISDGSQTVTQAKLEQV
jgi:hypothetical protein